MSAWSAAWAELTLPWLLETTLCAGLVLTLLRLGRRLSPHLRSALATLGLVKSLLPPLLLPSGPLPVTLALVPAPAVGDGGGGLSWSLPAAVHLAGVAAASALTLAGVFQVRRLRAASRRVELIAGEPTATLARRFGLARCPEVRVADGLRVPFACGLRRPAIYLPAGAIGLLGPEALTALLAHEMVHLRLRDPLRAWLGVAVRALWWFHPLVRALVRRAEDLREERCDDVVLVEGLAARSHYARALCDAAALALSQGRLRRDAPGFSSALWRRDAALERRLLRVASAATARRRGLGSVELATLAVLAVIVLLSWTRRAPAAAPGQTIHYLHLGSRHGPTAHAGRHSHPD